MSPGPLPVEEARTAILTQLRALPAAPAALLDALGRVLAEPVVAPFPLPRWTNAAMDGYAVRGDDVRGASTNHPVVLPVVAQLPAGAGSPPPLGPGEAMRIFTGAPVPPGADSVIRQEDSDRGAPRVTIRDDRDVGRNIRHAGSDAARGDTVLTAGTVIGPGEIALLASLAVVTPLVHARPRVAIISTGDELAPLDDLAPILAGTHLADSNTPTLQAMVALAGAASSTHGPVRDEAAALTATVAGCGGDLVVTVGGVSVGDHDHVPAAMAALGGRVLFRRVRLRPGGPTTAARLPDGRLWIALPGNPVSAMVTFTLFVAPAIRCLAGHADPRPVTSRVRLDAPVARHPTLALYLRAGRVGEGQDGVPLVRPTGSAGSAQMTTMRGAELLLRVPSGEGMAEAGTLATAVAFPTGGSWS